MNSVAPQLLAARSAWLILATWKWTGNRTNATACLVITITLLAALQGCLPLAGCSTKALPIEKVKNMRVIGHRGAAGLAPENTLAALRTALDLGVDGLEMDVLLSAEGEVVVHHDYHLNPDTTRDQTGRWLKKRDRKAIMDLSIDQIKAYDIGRLKPLTVYARRYPDQQPADGERIPALREVLDLLKSQKAPDVEIWLEIKTSPEKPQLTPAPEVVAEAVVQLLKKEATPNPVRLLSFDWRALIHCRKIHPDIPLVFLSTPGRNINNLQKNQPGPSPWLAGLDIDDFGGSVPRAIKAIGGRYWGPHFKSLTLNQLQEAHNFGIQVFPWTVDNTRDIQHMMTIGVDGIITNRPDRLQALMTDR
jgi:glycerophosphoryl diester phosphodiesterase